MTIRTLMLCACAALLVGVAGSVSAGPNEGGALILHANPSLTFTSDIANYCGMSGLDSCSHAVTSVPWEPGKRIVFHALAAFPRGSSPRLKGLSFGISYDPAKFILAARGSCADFELPDGTWPASGTGTAQTWTTETQTGLLTEVYWFAGYAYAADEESPDSTTVELISHPLHGGTFADDGEPRAVDTIETYGQLRFGTAGESPCPSAAAPGSEPDTPTAPGGDTPADDSAGNCALPVVCEITENNYLICQIGTDSLAFSGVPVDFSRDEADTLRLNGIPILPTRVDVNQNTPDPESIQYYGDAPRAQQLIESGLSLQDAVATLLAERRVLAFAAEDRYRSVLSETRDSRMALQAAVGVFRSSSLVDSSGTGAEGSVPHRPPAVRVLFAGEHASVTYSVVPFPWNASPSGVRQAQCRIADLCKELLDKRSRTSVVIIKNGNITVKTGAVAEDYLRARGK